MAKNYDLILLQSKSLLDDFKLYNNKNEFEQKTDDEFNKLMIVKYEYLYNNCLTIYNQCIENKMDMSILEYMIQQIKDIEKNKISQHNASIKVGEKLLDKYVKPIINNNK
jgi:hypothetical protein